MVEAKSLIYVLGGPGSGKGTQSKRTAEEYGIGYISTGDLLRDVTKPGVVLDEAGNALGKYADDPTWADTVRGLRDDMKAGKMVNDDVVIDLVLRRIPEFRSDKVFLDGFPRNSYEVEQFNLKGVGPRAILVLEVPDDVLLERLVKRGQSSGRADDNEESIKKRLQLFHTESEAVINYYVDGDGKGKAEVVKIDGNRPEEVVRADFIAELKKIWPDLTPVSKCGCTLV